MSQHVTRVIKKGFQYFTAIFQPLNSSYNNNNDNIINNDGNNNNNNNNNNSNNNKQVLALSSEGTF